jgi:lipoyl(octanoyl) transferase
MTTFHGGRATQSGSPAGPAGRFGTGSESRGTYVEVRDLGRTRYAEAFALQKEIQRQVIAAREEPAGSHPWGVGALLLVEHDPPVITISRRKTARQHLVATEEMLAKAGVEVAETDRGGDITYHGPGQLVAYPIIDLNTLGLRLHGYMRFLEDVIIDTLACFGMVGSRDESATGVWVHSAGKAHASPYPGLEPPEKICAMGVRVSRWVTMHGLALNVKTNLTHFNLIIPCGLAGRTVTSMQRELGEACPGMDDVKRVLVERFEAAIAERLGAQR